MIDRDINSAMKIMHSSAMGDKRKLKAQFRKIFSTLSSDDANSLFEECRTIHENIHAIAEKSFGNKKLSEYEEKYLDSLPLDQELKKELWQEAMFSQFR